METPLALLIGTFFAIVLIVGYLISTINTIINDEDYKEFTIFGNVLVVIPFIYSLVYMFLSERKSGCISGVDEISYWDTLYFSYITWTTLGYGDLEPIGICRVFAVSEAVLGFLFLAMIVSYFLHLYQKH